MQKLKSLNLGVLSILKYVLIGIVTTLIGIVLLAVLLKFVDIPSNVINYINDIIKALSIFVIVLLIKKQGTNNLFIKAILGGIIYYVLSLIIFSILNGGFSFNVSIVYDLIFAVIVSVISTIIINLTRKRA